MHRRSLSGVIRLRSEFGPLAVAFPDAHVHRELDFVVHPFRDQLADILDRRVLDERVPVLVVVVREDRAQGLFQIGEIEEHAAFVVPLDEDVDLVRVAVQRTAALVAREVMRAIDVFCDSEFHPLPTKGTTAIKVGLRPQSGVTVRKWRGPFPRCRNWCISFDCTRNPTPGRIGIFLPSRITIPRPSVTTSWWSHS